MAKRRIRQIRERRSQLRKSENFPTARDMEKAEKMAKRVSPMLAAKMTAETKDAP